MGSPHFPSLPNPFMAIAIAGAVTTLSVGLALGYPLAGATIAAVFGVSGMLIANSKRIPKTSTSEKVTESTSLALESTSTSKTISRLSLLTALVTSQAYLAHAVFFAHALTPPDVYVIDPRTNLHLVSGQIGNIEEVFHWDGLISTMLISALVFVVGWMAARGTARLLATFRSSGSSIQAHQDQFAQAITASDITTAPTGGIA